MRRTDPGRRDRIVDAALETIAEFGVAGTTHRRVAALADVPLGSMTYHFASLDALLREAFERFSQSISTRFVERMRAATNRDEAIAAVSAIIAHDVHPSPRDLVLSLELYTLAARDPAYRELTRNWMARSREALELHFPPSTARQLDALIEGLTIHLALDTDPADRAVLIRDAVARITD